MKKIKKYSGVIIPIITPFTQDEKLDECAIEKIIENMAVYNCIPLLFGTTGETASITQTQKINYVNIVYKKFLGKIKIYAAISDNCFDDAILAAKTYFDLGIDAIVVLLPSYYPITSEQMLNYYEKFADKIDGPMFIYNIPSTTHLSIPLDIINKLSYHEKIVGIKDSERDYQRLIDSIELWKNRDDFSHFIGWGEQCFNGMWMGSDGIVPSTGNFVPGTYKEMYESVLNNDKEKGETAQKITMEVAEIYQKDRILSQSLPALKVMMNEVGLCGINVKLPFTNLPNDEEIKIRKKTKEIINKYNLNWI